MGAGYYPLEGALARQEKGGQLLIEESDGCKNKQSRLFMP